MNRVSKEGKKDPLFSANTRALTIGGVVALVLIAGGLFFFPPTASADVIEAPPAKVVSPAVKAEAMAAKARIDREITGISVILEDAPLSQAIDTIHIITYPDEAREFIPLENMTQVTHLVLNNECVIMIPAPETLMQKVRLTYLSRTKCFLIQVQQKVVNDDVAFTSSDSKLASF
jgi:hypothetical protein